MQNKNDFQLSKETLTVVLHAQKNSMLRKYDLIRFSHKCDVIFIVTSKITAHQHIRSFYWRHAFDL